VAHLLVRHGRAGDPDAWVGDDRARPVDEIGRLQAQALVQLLEPHAIARVLTSPYLRCVQSIEPLARARRLPVEYRHELGDDAEASEALALISGLGVDPLALCSHGELIRALLGEELEKGEVAVFELTDDGLEIRERLQPQI
jgi:phosphohistidine phosphatase SixA